MKEEDRGWTVWFLFVVIMWVVLSLCGCKQVEYVPVHLETKDSIYLTKVVHDSVFVGVEKVTKTVNDTVYIKETKYKYKEKVLIDTVYIERMDSVQVPYPVEKKLSKWEQACVSYGGEAIIVCFVLMFIVVWLIYKRFF